MKAGKVYFGPNLYHSWFDHKCRHEEIIEVTIQFHEDLFHHAFLQKNQLSFIRTMFDRSRQGILFSEEAILSVRDRILNLRDKLGFGSVLELMSILLQLSQPK